jgi:hypothetical protein
MREKNKMGEGGCMFVVEEKKKRRRKKKGRKGTWVVGKIKGNKKEKRNGEWVKRGKGKERKTKLVLFVCSFCLVQNVEL